MTYRTEDSMATADKNVIKKAEEALRAQDGDLQVENEINMKAITITDGNGLNLQTLTKPAASAPYRFIPLKMGGGGRTHVVSDDSKRLIEEEVSLVDLERMTTLFYEKAFLDPTLDQFIRSHGDPHAGRFAKWIHQKLSGSSVWDKDRYHRRHEPVHDRTSAHVAAWYSPKRPSSDVGRHFKLDECRVWMRLHFWALRESGLMETSPTFADFYSRFIAHFVRVYESTAPAFARDSLRWSASNKNIKTYIENGRRMTDVLGLNLRQALKQIPKHEANDDEYPYNQSPYPMVM